MCHLLIFFFYNIMCVHLLMWYCPVPNFAHAHYLHCAPTINFPKTYSNQIIYTPHYPRTAHRQFTPTDFHPENNRTHIKKKSLIATNIQSSDWFSVGAFSQLKNTVRKLIEAVTGERRAHALFIHESITGFLFGNELTHIHTTAIQPLVCFRVQFAREFNVRVPCFGPPNGSHVFFNGRTLKAIGFDWRAILCDFLRCDLQVFCIPRVRIVLSVGSLSPDSRKVVFRDYV